MNVFDDNDFDIQEELHYDISADEDDHVPFTTRDNLRRILRADPRLTRLTVDLARNPPCNDALVTVADIKALGRGIGNTSRLRELTLSQLGGRDNIDDARQRFQLMYKGINQNKSLTKFSLSAHGADDNFVREMIQLLGPFLEQKPNLQCLGAYGFGTLDRETMRRLFEPLARRRSPLDMIDFGLIRDNLLMEELVTIFLENQAVIPKKLKLNGYDSFISQNGNNLIETFLSDPRCTLEELVIHRKPSISNSLTISLANSLVGNKKLKKMIIPASSISTAGWDAFSNALCNTTSIDATYYSSNHTLHSIGRHYFFYRESSPDNIRQYLELNLNEDKQAVARQKVYTQHFVRDFCMLPFKGMAPDLLGRVLAFIDKARAKSNGERNDQTRHSILYELIKNSSSVICDLEKPRSTAGRSHRKRRHVHFSGSYRI